MADKNKQIPRYIKLINIETRKFTFSYSIGNPFWFIEEFKKLKRKDK